MRALVALLLLVLSSSAALARLGETPAQCDARYGKPSSTGRDSEVGLPQRFYRKNGLLLVAIFAQGRCVQITFGQVPDGATSREITARNSMGGQWKLKAETPKGNIYVSQADGRAVAEAWIVTPRFAGDTAIVMISDPAFAKGKGQAALLHSQAKAAARMQGF